MPDSPSARQIGHACRIRRAELHLTQDDVAKRGGMHRNYVGALERGAISSPGLNVLTKLAAGLDESVAELLERATGLDVPERRRRTA